jgi:hypothetical protein
VTFAELFVPALVTSTAAAVLAMVLVQIECGRDRRRRIRTPRRTLVA